MLAPWLLFALGLGALLTGGYLVVEGSSSLARSMGTSPLVVGLTVVAFGTSAPELAVNLAAAIERTTDVAFGNVIGSNIANLGLILGLAATVRTLDIQSTMITREIPIMLLATAAAAVMALDLQLVGRPSAFDRTDGLLLLLFFAAFLYVIAGNVLRRRIQDPLLVASGSALPVMRKWPIWTSAGISLLGLAALGAGGHLAVRGATDLATAAGAPVAVIGLSIVAVGTSLPELVTSLVAAVRREADIAVGNIVGSTLFNLLFIMGITATVRSVPQPPSGQLDVLALVVITVLVLPFSITTAHSIVRSEGLILLVSYAAYIAWRFGLFA